ncbi:hypothetical protein JK201_16820 [Gluconobacter kondonii]|nr:hypothetical protein [Gluconobacter kondonii]MBS1055147.1 hypothetical protein [Gluconobacter kondonii]
MPKSNIPLPTNPETEAQILEIAKRFFHVTTFEEQKSGADFHEVGIWTISQALERFPLDLVHIRRR